MKAMKRMAAVTALLTLLAQSGLAAAPTHGKEPLKIKSNELHADNEKKTATFEGSVVARQGDLTLYTDKLVISYGESGKDLSKVEAFGHVRIVQGDREAVGAHAVYDNKGGRIVLDGSPRVMQGKNLITGKEITYYVDEQRSVVTGGRVEATIYPGEKDAGAKP
ncbi:lipopolysaccharide transport periplasmic protein LptA [Geomonas sp. RF6]|uniref:lipopolysaccharide transport periplasmic protein LptA n=1 Tax=Geomonas sp. RF6 TaxID=2897342 RepID=UPI001E2E4B2D|nr:lipopolysaccharide transport periplasmic protein LptA [Geomonas sp. RF6]UFS68655.1 lipopolysaccharide transport periplasmic protein LptA [Geomonas sp. RF6]